MSKDFKEYIISSSVRNSTASLANWTAQIGNAVRDVGAVELVSVIVPNTTIVKQQPYLKITLSGSSTSSDFAKLSSTIGNNGALADTTFVTCFQPTNATDSFCIGKPLNSSRVELSSLRTISSLGISFTDYLDQPFDFGTPTSFTIDSTVTLVLRVFYYSSKR